MILSIIAAVGKNGAIGMENKLIWSLPSDLKRFKALTMGYPILMGRKTFESIGRALPGRKNIVISSTVEPGALPDVIVASSFQKAVEIASKDATEEAFVIGGERVFREALPRANKLYITLVDTDEPGDTFFPQIDYSVWHEVGRESVPQTDRDQYPFIYINYERIR